jgi:hypothetical protein
MKGIRALLDEIRKGRPGGERRVSKNGRPEERDAREANSIEPDTELE